MQCVTNIMPGRGVTVNVVGNETVTVIAHTGVDFQGYNVEMGAII